MYAITNSFQKPVEFKIQYLDVNWSGVERHRIKDILYCEVISNEEPQICI